MGGVDEVAGFNGKVDMDERIARVDWVLSKGITPTRTGNAGQGQEAVWNIPGTRMSAPDCSQRSRWRHWPIATGDGRQQNVGFGGKSRSHRRALETT